MKMITDGRSAKAAQIAANPACEMVWWFAKSSEQYRIEGELQLVGADGGGSAALAAARKQQWGELSDPAREQFFWGAPGPFAGADGDAAILPKGGRDAETGKVLEAPSSFNLMLLRPTRVHYLRLTDNFAQLDQLAVSTAGTEGDGWTAMRMKP